MVLSIWAVKLAVFVDNKYFYYLGFPLMYTPTIKISSN